MYLFKKSKLRALQTTLELLAGFHAVPLDNPAFMRQYRQIFALIAIMKGQKNV